MERTTYQEKPAYTMAAFLQKVKEVLARCAHLTVEMVIAVMKRLHERGIWPSGKTVSKQKRAAQNHADKRSQTGPTTLKRSNAGSTPTQNAATDQPSEAPSAYGLQVQANTAQVKEFLLQHYEVRYNVLDGRAEVRHRPDRIPKDAIEACDLEFHPLTPVTLNTIVLHLHENGIPCWDRDVTRLMQSRLMPQYHPLKDYLDHLPAWDGTDRVTALGRRISDHPLWLTAFSCWMRAMVRQWLMCTETETSSTLASNQLALILISREQGLHKSTFCRKLLPDALGNYFTDKFELASRNNLEFPLCRFALVNLDEFDRFSASQMTKLKNLMQLSRLNVRRPHASHFESMNRTASFIGTSNTGELLTDPTGSRRFFCQEVDHLIDCDTPIDHAQLYAQLLHELAQDCPYYLNKDEESQVQLHNRAYYKASALCEAFSKLFVAGQADYAPAEESGSAEVSGQTTTSEQAGKSSPCLWLSATEIFKAMQEAFGARIVTGTPCQLGKQLTFLQVKKKHTKRGTLYCVKRNDAK